jgi:transposase-like protein
MFHSLLENLFKLTIETVGEWRKNFGEKVARFNGEEAAMT